MVTGGIGSGKSTVAHELSLLGWSVLDADRVGHLALEMAAQEVATIFPAAVIAGVVDRATLAEIVFGDPSKLFVLEALTHPIIEDLLQGDVGKATWPIAVEISAPSFANRLEGECLVVDAPETVRFARARARGMKATDLKNRLSVQPERAAWLRIADFVLDNGGSRRTVKTVIRAFDSFWRKQ